MEKSKLRWQILVATSLIAAGIVAAACTKEVEVFVPGTPTVIIEFVPGTPTVIKETIVVTATPTPPPPEPTATPTPGPLEKRTPGTYIHADIGDPESLDPAWQYDSASGSVIYNVYEPLLFYERAKIDAFVPVLSTGWNVSQDGLTYTFSIRDGVGFQEGGTLEPHDVAYTFQRGMLQDRAGGPQWVLLEPLIGMLSIEGIATKIADVEDFADVDAASLAQTCERVKQAVTFDDAAGTATFNLAKAFGPFLQILASNWGVIIDKEWTVAQGGWDGDCATWSQWHDPVAEESVIFNTMNGTGPFKLERWVPSDEWSLVRNEDYWLTEPLWEGGPSGPSALDRVVVKIIPEWGTRLAMFQAGDADSIYVPRQFLPQVEPLINELYEGGESDPANRTLVNEHGIARVFKSLPATSSMDAFFTFQVDVAGGNPFVGSGQLDGLGIPPDFFSDEHVRKAFSYAFDYDVFIEDIWLNEAFQRTGPIIAGHIGHNPDQPKYSLDTAKAEEEFKLAFDGTLWDTGFFMVLTYNTGNDQRKAAAEILELSIESINPAFKIAVQEVPWPTYLKQMVGARLPVFFIGWGEDYHHPHNWVVPYLHSSGTFAAWQAFPADLAAELDTKVELCVTLLGDQAKTCYEELQALAQEKAIDIFLTQPQGRRYEQLWVEGWYFNSAYPTPYNWYYSLSK
ncbi:MAG: ABC transporter substrate-binding protein [Dehalococcoidia bacterium]